MPSSSEPPCACTTLRKASRVVSRLFEERFAPTGLTINQFAVLRALDRQPDQPLSRLADGLAMERTSLYRLIAPLEQQGLLTIAAGRGRARIASMTPAGRAAMERATPVWADTQAEFLNRFGRDAWTSLAATLSRVVALSSYSPVP